MNDKTLQEKAIDIKGKQYVLVSDRILYFNENYPNGSIQTRLLSDPEEERVVIRADIYPDWAGDGSKKFTGHSQAVVGDGYINKTSALENAETSAVGRALAMMGIGVIDSVASVDEINKAKGTEKKENTNLTVDVKRKRIAIMARELTGKEIVTADDVSDLVGLSPETKNYDEVLTRLEALVAERQQEEHIKSI